MHLTAQACWRRAACLSVWRWLHWLWLWKEAVCLGVLILLLFFFFFFFLHKCSLAACLIPEQGYFAIIADCFVLIYFYGTHCSRALYGAPSCSSFQETNKPTAAEMWGRHWGNWMAGERLGWFLSGVGTTRRCMGTSSPPQSTSLITIG